MATSVKLDDELTSRVRHLAELRQRSLHWIMREAIREYVDREEKREAFRRDAIKAWQEYQETGVHATGEEVIEWLDTWGEENEKTPPECHT